MMLVRTFQGNPSAALFARMRPASFAPFGGGLGAPARPGARQQRQIAKIRAMSEQDVKAKQAKLTKRLADASAGTVPLGKRKIANLERKLNVATKRVTKFAQRPADPIPPVVPDSPPADTPPTAAPPTNDGNYYNPFGSGSGGGGGGGGSWWGSSDADDFYGAGSQTGSASQALEQARVESETGATPASGASKSGIGMAVVAAVAVGAFLFLRKKRRA